MSNPADARRRWFGLFFLFVAAGLLIWGQTLLKPHLKGLLFIGYWLACLGFTLLALLTALLDMMVVRYRIRKSHRELLEKTWNKIDSRSAKWDSETSEDFNRRSS